MGKSEPPKSVVIEVEVKELPKPRENAQLSCADWNALLVWARAGRGPQWDSSTAMYHVDQNPDVAEYWQGVEAKPVDDQTPSGIANAPMFQHPGLRPHIEGDVTYSSSGRPQRSSRRGP